MGWLRCRACHGDPVAEALLPDARIALPAIGVDEAPRPDDVDDEALQALGGEVQCATKPNPADLAALVLGCDEDYRAIDGPTATCAWLLSSQIALIHLNLT